jgi:hypothetical protein
MNELVNGSQYNAFFVHSIHLCVCRVLGTWNNHLAIQHKLTGFYNRDGVFTARYGLKLYNSDYIQSSKYSDSPTHPLNIHGLF